MSSNLGLSSDYHPSRPVLDGLGIFYIAGAGVWTVLITSGMVFQWTRRNIPFLRIRRLKLTFLATYVLHLFWIFSCIGYSLAPVVPEQIVFWLTSILYPIGLGLFFVSNAELLEVARLQQSFVDFNGDRNDWPLRDTAESRSKTRSREVWERFRELDSSLRMIILVVLGWFFQIVMTLVTWFISRKFHSSWGIAGTEVRGNWYVRHVEQGKGWEWWPAYACQFFWYFVVAPIILWRARYIRDTHGWRIQTSVCCLSTLFTLPMYLVAIYVPGMRAIDRYWSPIAWISISIWFIQAFTVFTPCFQILRHQTLKQETLDAIVFWESKTMQGRDDHVLTKDRGVSAQPYEMPNRMRPCQNDMFNRSTESLFTMRALEHTLVQNPEPLRRFASLRDFSGENIAFLTAIQEWKTMWTRFENQPGMNNSSANRELFKRAVRLYANFVSTRYAVFPINLSAHDFQKLDLIFRPAAKTLYGDSGSSSTDDISPFRHVSGSSDMLEAAYSNGKGQDSLLSGPGNHMREAVDFVTEKVQYFGDIPREFHRDVFDEAEKSIKYLVLTNTWPKFIKLCRPGSSGTTSDDSAASGRRLQSAHKDTLGR